MRKTLFLTLSLGFIFSGCSVFKAGEGKAEKSEAEVKDNELNVRRDTTEIEITPEEERVYHPSETRINDLIHTKLQVSFDWEKTYLNGKANLTFTPYFYPTDSLILDAKGFDLHEVALVNGEKRQPLEYAYDTLKVYIQLPQTYTRKDTYEIFIDYTAKPNELKAGGSAAITSDIGLYFINPQGEDPDKPRQIWTQGETEASSAWFPTIDAPNEKTSQEMYITVADSFVTLSNGELVYSSLNEDGTRTDYWKQELPHTPYLFMMAIGKFAVVKDKWKDLEVNYYVEPEYEQYAMDIFGNTPEMMQFYSDILNYEYPWVKYSQVVVRDFVSGAMENTTASVFFEGLHQTKRELLDSDHEDIIAHELIHHWFGDLVTTESWANLPLNESFATYGEYLWFEYKYGRDEADYHLHRDLQAYLNEAEQKQVPLIRYYYDDKEDMFDRHSYQKGGRVLHMLRKYVGDEAFFKALNLYLTENKYQPAEIAHLRLAFEEVTGEDLHWFFNQWFLSPGHPVINVQHDHRGNTAYLYVQQQPSIENAPVFRLPVEVAIYLSDTVLYENITVDETSDTFRFEVSEQPQLVLFDSEQSLLAVVDDQKSPEQWVYQFYNAPVFMARYNSLQKLVSQQDKKSVREVFKAALEDDSWVMRRYAVDKLDLEDSIIAVTFPERLKDLAQNDPESKVRSAALDRLSEIADATDKALFKKALDDSSYIVIASGLSGLFSVVPEEAIKEARKLEKEENVDIKIAVADIYAVAGEADDHTFFISALEKASGYEKFLMINSYGKYLYNVRDSVIMGSGLLRLKESALGEGAWWISYSAIGAIVRLQKQFETEKEMIEKLLEKKTEEDEGYEQLQENLDYLVRQLEDIGEIMEEVKREKKDIIGAMFGQ